MDDDLVISTNFPFKRCGKCREMIPDANAMYVDGSPAVIVVGCANKDICQNAYDVWKGDDN